MDETVIRWTDGHHPEPLYDQLRRRPNRWAVVAEDLRSSEVGARLDRIEFFLGEGFEVWAQTTDDGEYGVIYEIQASYIGAEEA